jgi:processive 1,2-diacylglycerol beta-glucosyltransferase
MHVLFLYASTGSGHVKAAGYVRQALIRQNPGICCSMADVLNLCPSSVESFILKGFRFLISRFPHIYRFLYRFTENNALFNYASGILFSGSIKQLIRLCQESRVSSIVCTHPFALLFASEIKKKLGENSPITMGIITDYRIHRFWLYHPIDMYFVPNEEMKAELLKLGWRNDQVYVTGIPCPIDITIENISNEHQKPFLIISGGGWGLGSLEKTTKKLLQLQHTFSLLVVTGKNVSLNRKLKKLEAKNDERLMVKGTIPRLYDVMKNASAVVTKPGGLTVTEAMILKKPLILLNPLPGAEEHNYKFLVEHNAAISFEDFLKNPDMIMNWKGGYSDCQALATQNNSSFKIAEKILYMLI